jgi:periplasmic protein TonB
MIQHTTLDFSYKPKTQSMQISVVVALHFLAIWALVITTNQGAVSKLLAPAQVVLINEETKPNLPPQPTRKVVKETAPKPDLDVPRTANDAVSVVFSNEPYAASSSNSKPSASIEAAMICPNQVKPEIPRQALIKNIQGLIKVEAVVAGGSVKEIHFLSGPRIFHEAVRNAMLQYKCALKNDPVIAVQEFNFHFE